MSSYDIIKNLLGNITSGDIGIATQGGRLQGSTLTAAVLNTDKNEPAGQSKPTTKESIIYPNGLDTAWKGSTSNYAAESGPAMRITAFEYTRGFDTTVKRSLGTRQFTIMLPTPGNLQQGFSANWAQFQGGLVSAASGGGGGAEAAISAGVAGGLSKYVGALANITKNSAGDKVIPEGLQQFFSGVMDETTRNVASAAMGMSMNPRQEVAFNGMNIRTHSFQYQLTPRNEKEARDCMRLIYLMQRSMHPTYADPAKLGLEYPYEFIIEYFTANGDPQPGIMPIPDSYLTAFNVVYNPGQVAARFHIDGSPISFQISMQFTEGVAITRDEYDILASTAGITAD